MPYQRRYYYIMSLVNCSRIKSYVDIPIRSHPYGGNKMLFFAYYFIIFYCVSLRKYHFCKTISGIHKTTPLVHLFVKFKDILVKLRIL